ncbi:SulP family inorganic anion transporter [Nitrosovibrio sp. Nv17]|uniref:SulP family inorganic anion transporter n=1 Tax=Nitrosovibrio sp. Nv17 TaxID=1855339 RepID=UPI000908957A|nr:SulP family inorganic anion transporter [Nitrosovibrio sp. Nv17]SFW25022.1 Sulfate permease, MFS superfamily [Nitrosovibrio sp. Nv17]
MSATINSTKLAVPKDGLSGMLENLRYDFMAGFFVFLLALPLSLGIAKAGDFPPAMGVLTAMIGGLLVTFFAGSQLTIKGPAAGLITIVAGCVAEVGGGPEGWKLALGVMVVAGVLQVTIGLMKAGSLSDFFPLSAVHGMLAAIGLIIISKQAHILLGIDPASLAGMGPVALYAHLPHSLMNPNGPVAIIGILGLIVLFGMPMLKFPLLKKIPAPMVVLLISIPGAIFLDFKSTQPAHILVHIGEFWSEMGFNADFSAIGTGAFWKYVIMFLLVGSLESCLTVKAMDSLDPWRRQSNFNKDLIAVGAGNTLAAVVGGSPMISEVARSSANINFGARTRWANFFHGACLFISMLFLIPAIELIPNAALAAMLIYVGYRLASPHEFFKTYKIGSDQLTIFLVTIGVTVASDLLMGIGAGILVKFVFHMINGASPANLFKARYQLRESGGQYFMDVQDAAIFSNLIGFKKALATFQPGKKITLDFHQATLVDHTFMEFLEHFEEQYVEKGGEVTITGFDRFEPFSDHPLAGRKVRNQKVGTTNTLTG